MKNEIEGYLRMLSHKELSPVNYSFELINYKEITKKTAQGEIKTSLPLNTLLGKNIRITFYDEIRCVDCGKITKKSFGGGSCYNCLLSLASNDFCILKPSECHFHKGTCREEEWGKAHCFQKHIVYLANSTGIKVGITKENPSSKRWVDQGAIAGLPLLEVKSRLESGLLELEIAKYIPDKSSWQKLISDDSEYIDLEKKSKEILELIDLKKFDFQPQILKPKITNISYPINSYPHKKKSLKPNFSEPLNAELLGIKGQYLLFSEGGMNIRSLSGYKVKINYD
jgi:hypothetical protein